MWCAAVLRRAAKKYHPYRSTTNSAGLWYLTPEVVMLTLVDKEWEREKMTARLLESNLCHGSKSEQPHFQPQSAHLGAGQPVMLTVMTARSWGYFQVVRNRGERSCMITWLSFTMVKQCGIHMSEKPCVQHASDEWYCRVCSAACAHEPRSQRRCYTRCYRFLWVCGTST